MASFADEIIMSIRPGLDVKVIVETDQRIEKIYQRNSQIYDIDGDSVILAQTEPSIKSSLLSQEIVVTYLMKEKHTYLRYGVSAVIAEFIDRYQLISKQHVRAIMVHKRSDPKPYNTRMWYRVQPTSKSGLDASICGKKVNVIDISLGGIRFSHDKTLQLERNNVIEVCFGMAGGVYTIEARIIRTWETEIERFRRGLGFAAAEFLNVSLRTEQELSRKICDIERENLSRLAPT
jgi:hypothetical protein